MDHQNNLYYLRSIKSTLDAVCAAQKGTSLQSEVLYDNRNWLDCYIDWLEKQIEPFPSSIEGHGVPCYYCNEPCNAFVGNPTKWPLAFSHRNEPGVIKWHHTGCVQDRLIENQSILT